MEKKLYEMSGSKECYYIGETYIGNMHLKQACEEAWEGEFVLYIVERELDIIKESKNMVHHQDLY